jgi:hypothetical protein
LKLLTTIISFSPAITNPTNTGIVAKPSHMN